MGIYAYFSSNMNRYLTFNYKGFGYQIVSRGSINQTFGFAPGFVGMLSSLEGRYTIKFRSDSNYQLAVM